MKTLKLTPVQIFRLSEAHKHSAAVLAEIKAKKLSGEALQDMKVLEASVGQLEIILIGK